MTSPGQGGINAKIGADFSAFTQDLRTGLGGAVSSMATSIANVLGQAFTNGMSGAGQASGDQFIRGLNGSGIDQAGTRLGRELGDGIEDGAKQADPTGDLQNDIKGETAKFAAIGGAIGAAMGTALAAGAEKAMGALSDGVGAIMDREAGTDKLQAQLDLSEADAARLGGVAGKVWANNFGEDVGAVNEVIRGAVNQGVIDVDATEKDIKQVSEGILGISAAFDKDAAEVNRAVSGMLRSGMASSATEAMDLYGKALTTNADRAEDLSDFMGEFGVQMQSAGLDGATSIGLINQAMEAGARDASLVGDAIKEWTLIGVGAASDEAIGDAYKALGLDPQQIAEDIAKGGPAAQAAFQSTLDAMRKMPDSAEKTNIATAIFGAPAEDMKAAFLAMDPKSAADTLGEFTGYVDRANEAMGSNTAATVETFKRSMQQGVIDFLGGTAIPAIEKFAGMFGITSDNIGSLMQVILPLAGAIAAVWAITKVVAIAQAAWNAAQLIGTGISKAAAAAQWLWNTALLANPVVLIVGLIIGAFVLLYTQSETFREIVGNALSWIGEKAGWLWDQVKKLWDGFMGFLTGIPEWFSGALDSAGDFFSGIGDGIMDLLGWFTDLPGNIVGALGDLGSTLLGIGGDLVSGLWEGISGAKDWLLQKVGDFFGDLLPDFVKDMLGIHSPSRVFADIGKHLPTGMAIGIEATAPTVLRAASRLADDVTEAAMFAPPTIASVDAARAAADAAALETVAAGAMGGTKHASFTGPTTIYTADMLGIVDQATEDSRFRAMAKPRG